MTDPHDSVTEGLKAMVKTGVGSFAVPHKFLVKQCSSLHALFTCMKIDLQMIDELAAFVMY